MLHVPSVILLNNTVFITLLRSSSWYYFLFFQVQAFSSPVFSRHNGANVPETLCLTNRPDCCRLVFLG
jgi:hypothetical protein